MSKYTRDLLAVILAVVLVLPAAAFAMLPEANARSSTGMDGPTVSGTVVDPDTSGRWEIWAAGHNGNKVTDSKRRPNLDRQDGQESRRKRSVRFCDYAFGDVLDV